MTDLPDPPAPAECNRITPLGPWVQTFAWRPRKTFDGHIIWFRLVWKRHIFIDDIGFRWVYRSVTA